MADIKPLARIVQKWIRVAPTRTTDYTEGLEEPRRDWATAAIAAEGSWSAALQAAITQKRFSGGIKKAGTARWRDRALKKGPHRWAEGIGLAGPDYAEGYGPHAEEIQRVPLPPRWPKGDPRNLQRVEVIAKALHAKKLALKGIK